MYTPVRATQIPLIFPFIANIKFDTLLVENVLISNKYTLILLFIFKVISSATCFGQFDIQRTVHRDVFV